MRWKTPPHAAPKLGERKHVLYFALWPKDLSDGTTVWLEKYWSELEFVGRGVWTERSSHAQ